jgi:hypothetical protein
MIVTGRIATSCESDWFVVDLASPSSLTTQLLADAAESCAGRSDLPDPFTLELIAANGQTRLVRGALVDGCPRVESSDGSRNSAASRSGNSAAPRRKERA